MASESIQKFKRWFPEFEDTPDRFISEAFKKAAKEMDPTVWGEDYREGLENLAAHKLAMRERSKEGRNALPGVRTSQQTGKESESAKTEGADALEATDYGREYKRLMPQNVSLPFGGASQEL